MHKRGCAQKSIPDKIINMTNNFNRCTTFMLYLITGIDQPGIELTEVFICCLDVHIYRFTCIYHNTMLAMSYFNKVLKSK